MIRILKELSKKEILLIIVCAILIICQVWLDLKLPEYMWKITELLETQWTEIWDIIHQWIFMLSIALISVVISMILVLCSSKIAANLSAKLRLKIYEKVQSFSLENVKNFSIASLCLYLVKSTIGLCFCTVFFDDCTEDNINLWMFIYINLFI